MRPPLLRTVALTVLYALAALALVHCREPDPSAGAENQPAPPASPVAPPTPPAPNQFFIAIVDSGIDPEHSWFANAFTDLDAIKPVLPDRFLPAESDRFIGWDVVDQEPSPVDRSGHGTHVAGIVARHLDLAQPTPFRLLIVRSGDQGHELPHLTAALQVLTEWKQAGLSIPLALLPVEYYRRDDDAAGFANFESALGSLLESGTLAIAAAGNRGNNNDEAGDQNHCYPSDFVFPNLLSVACTNRSGHLHAGSNYGAVSIDLAANGFGIESAWLHGKTRKSSGTSQSAAFVTARAAQLWIADRAQSPARIKELLLDQTRLHPSLAGRLVSNGFLTEKVEAQREIEDSP